MNHGEKLIYYLSGVRTLVTSSVNSFWKKRITHLYKRRKQNPLHLHTVFKMEIFKFKVNYQL